MPEEMGIFEVMYNCRAMRRLKPDPVPEELLLKLADAGNHGPTGSNVQNVRWIIVRDPEQKRKLADLNRIAIDRIIAMDTVVELPHHPKAKRDRMREAVLWQAEHLHETPALIVACTEYEQPAPDGAPRPGGGSVWPAVQNVLLAARALGLGAAPTSVGLANRPAVKEVLSLPDTVEAHALVPVGYPMGKFGPVTRLPVEETVRWDRWA